MSDVTCILSQIESGDPAAAQQLLPLVYEELRRLVALRVAPHSDRAGASEENTKAGGELRRVELAEN